MSFRITERGAFGENLYITTSDKQGRAFYLPLHCFSERGVLKK